MSVKTNTEDPKPFRLYDPTRKNTYLETKFYPNGNTKTTGVFVDDKKTGIFTTLYPNGNLKWRDNFLEGKQHGIVQAWYENNVLELEEYYIHGKKCGVCSYWDKNGVLINKKEYVNNTVKNLIGFTKYKSQMIPYAHKNRFEQADEK